MPSQRITLTVMAALAFMAPTFVSAQTAEEPAAKPAAPFTEEESARYMDIGRRAINHFFAAEAEEFIEMLAPEFAGQVGGVEGVITQSNAMAESAGMPISDPVEKMTRRGGIPQFWWEAEFSNYAEEPMVLRLLIDENGLVSGGGFSPKSEALADPEA